MATVEAMAGTAMAGTAMAAASDPRGNRRERDEEALLLSQEIQRLVDASREGRLTERGRADQFEGVHREMLMGVNEMLDAILLPIGEGNRILAQVSNGKIDELIAQTYKGDHEKMKQAINNVATVLQSLQKELVRLTDASKEGQLSDRGKPEQFQGAYAEIVRGVNTMLDAILLPIGEGNRILAQISNGKIDELIAQTYKGDHEKMKQAINNVASRAARPAEGIGALDGRFERRATLRSWKAGTIPGSLRRDCARREHHAGCHPAADRGRQSHPGANLERKNRRVDRPDLQGRPRKDETSHQQCRHRAARSAKGIGASDGRFEGRATLRSRKAGTIPGAYAEIVRGVNTMLDAILLPIGEGNRILAQVSNGKIDELIAQTYKGDHEKMKQAINNVATVLQGLQKELARLTEASNAGQLSERGRHDQFRGAYAEIVRGVNAILDAVIAPLECFCQIRGANQQGRHSRADHRHLSW